MAVFRELRGVNVKFLFSNPEKAHLRGTASFDVLRVKIGFVTMSEFSIVRFHIGLWYGNGIIEFNVPLDTV